MESLWPTERAIMLMGRCNGLLNHIMPPVGWPNDPIGFCHLKGEFLSGNSMSLTGWKFLQKTENISSEKFR